MLMSRFLSPGKNCCFEGSLGNAAHETISSRFLVGSRLSLPVCARALRPAGHPGRRCSSLNLTRSPVTACSVIGFETNAKPCHRVVHDVSLERSTGRVGSKQCLHCSGVVFRDVHRESSKGVPRYPGRSRDRPWEFHDTLGGLGPKGIP